MTLDPDLLGIYSAADQTIAELDRITAAGAAQRTFYRDQLRAVVAKLDLASPEEPEPSAGRRQRDDERRPPAQEQAPFVALPERTTPGGPFGPKVRDRLVREALSKSDW
jgi:hypothetical protein